MSHRTSRVSVLAGIAALTLTTLVVATAPAQAHPAGDRAVTAGATWLEAQLTDGLVTGHYPDENGDPVAYTDHGLTADVAFALDEVGGYDAEVAAIADAVAPEVQGWYDSYGTIYTGSAAKATVLAQVAGQDPTSFGGQDLQAVVEGNVAASAPILGRVQNVGETDWQTQEPADSLNVISQGWAARALAGQGSALADEVEAFLLDQQCDAGFFRYGLTEDKTAPEQGCVDGVDTAHLDTTALTVVNLLATPSRSARADAAVQDAVAWLETQQAADGSFDVGGTEGVNANTTGLAAWALAEAGRTATAVEAASWVRGLQVADIAPCSTVLAAENGAVAYDAEALASSRTAKSITMLRDQFRRTTAQALPALALVPAGNGPLGVQVPATAPEKSAVSVTVSGLGAGEPGCVTLGTAAKPVLGTGGDVTVVLGLSAGAATHPVKVTAVDGSSATATVTATVLPAPAPSVQPVPAPSVGDVVTKRLVKVRKNRFALKVACEATAPCEGRILVRSKGKVVAKPGQRARRIVVAKKSYAVAPGQTRKVVLQVRKPARRVLAAGKVKVRAVAAAPGARRTTETFWLKRAR